MNIMDTDTVSKELAELNSKIEAGTATGWDFNRQRALIAAMRGEEAKPAEGGVCLPITNWTRGRNIH